MLHMVSAISRSAVTETQSNHNKNTPLPHYQHDTMIATVGLKITPKHYDRHLI